MCTICVQPAGKPLVPGSAIRQGPFMYILTDLFIRVHSALSMLPPQQMLASRILILFSASRRVHHSQRSRRPTMLYDHPPFPPTRMSYFLLDRRRNNINSASYFFIFLYSSPSSIIPTQTRTPQPAKSSCRSKRLTRFFPMSKRRPSTTSLVTLDSTAVRPLEPEVSLAASPAASLAEALEALETLRTFSISLEAALAGLADLAARDSPVLVRTWR